MISRIARLLVVYFVFSSTYPLTNDDMDELADKTARAVDVTYRDKELTLRQEVEALEDKVWILKGEIDLMKAKQR